MSSEGPALPEGTVTVLSTDLVGSTTMNQRLGDEAATAVELELAALAAEQVKIQRGIVVKDTGDGLMVAFQSARRAVACAQEIQRATARRNRSHADSAVQLRVGLHTGEVLSQDGGLHGETLILAKRIEEVAPPGTIFASDTVHGVLGTARAELQGRGEFELKGIDAAWRLFEVPWIDSETTGVLPARERTPFVGRAPERARLVQAIEQARNGEGSFFLIAGEAGVGKSRLLHEAADEARRLGFRVLTGHCVDQGGAPPYLPSIEHIEEAARSVSPEQLRLALGENAPGIAKLMPELRARYSDIPKPVALPPEQERRYLLHGVTEFIERNARQMPLVLVFEDLHWADESTLLLVQHLAQRIAQMPVLAVGTYREAELKPGRPLASALPELLSQRLAEEIVLGRLGEADVAALIEGRAGRRPPPELVQLVFSETEGNPFFVEEVFRHLHEAGKLFEEDGNWRSGVEIADTEVPRTVGLVIGQRLERVGDDTRRILTVAALAGKAFRFDLLASFQGIDEDGLLDALEEAGEASLIEDVSTEREARYAFAHEQIRQTLLSLLSFARRQRLHLRMADAMEALYGGDAEQQAHQIAHHLYQAGAAADGERTARWLFRAAERALDAVAFEDALGDLDAARTVLPRDDTEGTAKVLRLRARALRGLARIEEALEDFAQAARIAPEGDERDAVLQARARLKLDLFRGREAIEDVKPLLERAREAGSREREVELLLMRSRGLWILTLDEPGDYAERTRSSYEEAYALARELGDRRAMCRALIPTTWFVDYWQDYRDQARRNNEEARALADEVGDEELQIDAASARLRLMVPAEAYGEALSLRERLEVRRDPLRLKEHLFWLMWQHYLRAEFEKCVETCDAGIALARQLGSPPVQYPGIKGLALTDMGRFGEAWSSLQEEVADDDHPFGRESAGDLESAEAKAKEVLDEAGRLSRTWMQQVMVDLLATIAARRGGEGRELADWLDKKSAEIGFHPGGLPQAEAALAAGEFDRALEIADSVAEGGARIGVVRGRIVALELGLRALARLERWDDLLERADRCLREAERADFRTRTWRILGSRANAREAMGDATGAAEDREAARAILLGLASTLPEGVPI
jgi:class 3 adenylate cyclase/tetratricopeptide (TPR) repeat protein